MDLPPLLTGRFVRALALANEVHGEQRRKGTRIPYVAHLLVVAGLVLEDGGAEDEAIAALLHDVVEDGGGLPMLERIREQFGERVARIVADCSDTTSPGEKEPWRERKLRYLDHLGSITDDGSLRVSLADKVHNSRSIVRDYRLEGPRLWERFNTRSATDQLWYYESLLEFFEGARPGPLTEDFRLAVDELAALVAREESGQVVG